MERAKFAVCFGVVFLLLMMMLIMILFGQTVGQTLPTQLPRVEDIVYTNHAVERHGQDAVEARAAIKACPPTNLRIMLCPPSARHGLHVRMWCHTGLTLCPGSCLTIAGIEKTTFIRPCAEWATCN